MYDVCNSEISTQLIGGLLINKKVCSMFCIT